MMNRFDNIMINLSRQHVQLVKGLEEFLSEESKQDLLQDIILPNHVGIRIIYKACFMLIHY